MLQVEPRLTLPIFKNHTMIDIRSHAIAAWPFECCGVVIDGEFHAKKNIYQEPMKGFLIDQNEWSDSIEAIIHSHPEADEAIPSAADIQYQKVCDRPFGIIPTRMGWAGELRWHGDYELELPLIGRQFVHGITDCYSLLRSYFWQKHKIYLNDYPRDNNWWLTAAPNLYLENFAKEGFIEVRDDLQEDDVLLIKLLPGTRGPHHLGIVQHNSLLLHHWGGELSRQVPLGSWLKYAVKRIRYAR